MLIFHFLRDFLLLGISSFSYCLTRFFLNKFEVNSTSTFWVIMVITNFESKWSIIEKKKIFAALRNYKLFPICRWEDNNEVLRHLSFMFINFSFYYSIKQKNKLTCTCNNYLYYMLLPITFLWNTTGFGSLAVHYYLLLLSVYSRNLKIAFLWNSCVTEITKEPLETKKLKNCS